MGLILVGILVGALLIGIAVWYLWKHNSDVIVFPVLITVAVSCIIVGLVTGIRVPVSGYGEPEEVSNTELVSLRDEVASEGIGSLLYVSILGTNSYTYYVEVDSTYASNFQKAYKSETISSSNVTIVEDDSYTDAKLVTYVRNGKKSFWTFAARAKEYEYVFYVPAGTIARDMLVG